MDFELPTFQSAPVRALFVYHVRFASPLAIGSKNRAEFFKSLNTLGHAWRIFPVPHDLLSIRGRE